MTKEIIEFFSGEIENLMVKGGKMLVTRIFSFSHSVLLSSSLKVVSSWECVVMG